MLSFTKRIIIIVVARKKMQVSYGTQRRVCVCVCARALGMRGGGLFFLRTSSSSDLGARPIIPPVPKSIRRAGRPTDKNLDHRISAQDPTSRIHKKTGWVGFGLRRNLLENRQDTAPSSTLLGQFATHRHFHDSGLGVFS